MFLLMFIFFFLQGGKLVKSISIGMFFIIFGSILDKFFYNRNYYHIFDAILTSVSMFVGGCFYFKERCKRSPSHSSPQPK